MQSGSVYVHSSIFRYANRLLAPRFPRFAIIDSGPEGKRGFLECNLRYDVDLDRISPLVAIHRIAGLIHTGGNSRRVS